MRPSILHVNGILYWVIRTYNPDTSVLKDADSTPTVAVRKNGASVGDSVTITKRSATTGIYDCSYDPAAEVEGDDFTFEETATVTGTTTAQATYSSSWAMTVVSEINDLSVMVENSNDILGKIDTGLQYDGENYQFTENMLENSASGGLTASGVRNAVGLASANLDSQFSYIPTGVATHTLTESYATSGSEMTLAQALYMIQQSITEFAISGVTISVKKLDGTEAASYTLNSSTRPSSRTRA